MLLAAAAAAALALEITFDPSLARMHLRCYETRVHHSCASPAVRLSVRLSACLSFESFLRITITNKLRLLPHEIFDFLAQATAAEKA